MGAMAIGAISSVICYFAVTKLKHIFDYDDSLDVFGVHGVGGIVGALLTGVFIREGYDVTGGFAQFLVQGKSVIVTVVWSAAAAAVALVIAKVLCGGLRVDEEVEHGGLDRTDHGEEAYNWEA